MEKITLDNPQEIIRRCVGNALRPGKPYPGTLDEEVAPWHHYVADSGHCILVLMPERRSIVSCPVPLFKRMGYEMRASFEGGYFQIDCPMPAVAGLEDRYNMVLGLTVLDADLML